jgi:integrase
LRAWPEQDVARYEARHPIGTKARLAFDLLLYTGVRRSDVVRLGPQMERDGKLVFSEAKGSSRIVKAHELPHSAAAAPKHRRDADRPLGLSGDGVRKTALGQSFWQLVQEAVP